MLERLRDAVWWGEQAAHFALGMAVAVPALWGPLPLVTAPIAALMVAVVREYEQRPVASWGDLAADVAFVMAGGLTAGGIVTWTGNSF